MFSGAWTPSTLRMPFSCEGRTPAIADRTLSGDVARLVSGERLGLTPSLFLECGDHFRKSAECRFDALPVRMAVPEQTSLIQSFGDFPTTRWCMHHLKGSDVLVAHKCRGEQRSLHQ